MANASDWAMGRIRGETRRTPRPSRSSKGARRRSAGFDGLRRILCAVPPICRSDRLTPDMSCRFSRRTPLPRIAPSALPCRRQDSRPHMCFSSVLPHGLVVLRLPEDPLLEGHPCHASPALVKRPICCVRIPSFDMTVAAPDIVVTI